MYCTSEAPDVRLPAIAPPADDLRGHPVGGSPHGMHPPTDVLAVLLGTAKVNEFHDSSGCHHDIGPLDVPAVHTQSLNFNARYLGLGVRHEAGICTIVISIKRAFK